MQGSDGQNKVVHVNLIEILSKKYQNKTVWKGY